jgi:hypothetical protein
MSAQITPATFAAGLTGGSNAGSTSGSTTGSSFVPDAGSTAASAGTIEAITEAVAGLNGLQSASTRTHVSAFDRVHQALTDALAAIDGV